MLLINGFVSTSSTNKWKAFFKFQIPFRIFVQKPKILAENHSKEGSGVNTDQIAMCYIINGFVSTCSKTNEKLF